MNLNYEYRAIFELNDKSLLFARIASDKIDEGDLDKALIILKNGIERFEEYPTPYFLMGKLLMKLGKIDEANDAFKKGNEFLNNEKTLNYYCNLTPNSTEDNYEDENQIPLRNNDLLELEDNLKTAKIKIEHDTDLAGPDKSQKKDGDEFKPLKGLVSETLASIYLNQSNYREAKAIYETLIEIQPNRKEYFEEKLSEINVKMSTRNLNDS